MRAPEPARLALLADYRALAPAAAPPPAAAAARIAGRIALARSLHLAETPSEASLLDRALRSCATAPRADQPPDAARRARRRILSQLYPAHAAHPDVDQLVVALAHARQRLHVLKTAIREQSIALCKLSDAANLLLLIADHVQILITSYQNSSSCPSSASDFSSDDESRTGCLFRSEEGRSHVYLSNLPPNFRVRYLRKCWGYAADALTAAVDHSAFLSKQLERDGRTELVPGITDKARPSFSLFELPGGFTIMLKPDTLQKMATDASNMRQSVYDWQARQRKFITRLRKDLTKAKKSVSSYEARLAEARQRLLTEEFASAAGP